MWRRNRLVAGNYMYVCMYACMYVCMYVSTYIMIRAPFVRVRSYTSFVHDAYIHVVMVMASSVLRIMINHGPHVCKPYVCAHKSRHACQHCKRRSILYVCIITLKCMHTCPHWRAHTRINSAHLLINATVSFNSAGEKSCAISAYSLKSAVNPRALSFSLSSFPILLGTTGSARPWHTSAGIFRQSRARRGASF